ncbi:MAG: polysaccharide pyruvyl transferase family protein [Prevotella sp.]|nr:polysaccharide pyruvyl transferase family protein [Prevotella sp.]
MEKSILRRAIRKIKRILARNRFPHLIKYIPKGNVNAVHISAFSNGNAGDTLLPVVLRDLFNQTIGVKKWHGKHVHKLFRMKDALLCNRNDLVVIGGGGLFLADTAPNDVSGWQWNCSIDMLHKIEKPLVAFAIGYNRFRGQADFKPIFTEHLNAFVEKAVFVGIRNHGSIECLKKYLHTKELQDKLVYQPCMTTLISKIYPSLTDFSHKEDFIAFNCAFDRQDLRSLNDTCLRSISKVALELSRITNIKYYSHTSTDKLVLPYFDELGIKYELIELKKVDQIVKCYAKPKLVIGMRGHSQMIPFGCNTPILSIVSHDKMQWFMDDIHHPEWGIDVKDPDFESKLLESAKAIYANTQSVMDQLKEEQNRLYHTTIQNMKEIKRKIGK